MVIICGWGFALESAVEGASSSDRAHSTRASMSAMVQVPAVSSSVPAAHHAPTKSTHQQQKQLRLMVAGGGAGVVAKTVVAPFERVKIVCQTGESVGMIQTTRAILMTEGVLGFWRGNMAACVRVVPHKAVLFGFSDVYKDGMRALSPSGELPAWGAFAAGSLSGFTASVLTYPLDLVRTRLSGAIGTNVKCNGIVNTFRLTLQEEGFRALFRGIGPTLAGSIPYEGIKFGSYDVLKTLLPEDIDPKADFVGKIVCGGGAGMIATILTYPNDTVRRRLQMQGSGGAPRIYKNAWDCYVKLARNEGFEAYYRGLLPTLVRAIPNMGIQFATYELLKGFLLRDLDSYVDVDEDDETAVRSSRYRLLTKSERMNEEDEVERIIEELKAQRRRTSKASDIRPQTIHSAKAWEDTTTLDTANGSGGFETAVLSELQQLKKAQLADLQAVEALKKAKEDADRRVMELERQLQQVMQQRNSTQSLASTVPSRPQSVVVIEEHSEDETERNNNWKMVRGAEGDESLPPPGFDDDGYNSTAPARCGSDVEAYRYDEGDECIAPEIDIEEPAPAWERGRSEKTGSNSSKDRRDSRSSSVSRSARSRSREDVVRRSAFFEEKQKAHEEAARVAAEAAARLERAKKAAPPARLLQRQEEAQRKKEEQVRAIAHEMYESELAKDKRVRAREVPLTTYLPQDGPLTAEEREQQRKQRIEQRSQELLQNSQLPSRMALAQHTTKAEAAVPPLNLAATAVPHMSVKVKKKIIEMAEEEERKRQRKPRPVPDFDQLHARWKKALRASSGATSQDAKKTVPKEFFARRAAKIDDLKARKEERKRRLAEKEAEEERRQAEAQQQLLAKARASASRGGGPKATKAEELRVKKVQSDLLKAEKEQAALAQAEEARAQRLREARRRVAAQVKASEDKRKSEYSGTYVELTSVEEVAKQRAKETRQQFKDAIQRNKERILSAVALRPSLMERFTTELQREEHKKNALAAVVTNVFQGNMAAMKGILSTEEEELAHDLVAAEHSDGEEEGRTKPKPAAQAAPDDDDDEDKYSEI
ncbi:TPA: hypothetical protein N0F65_007680 [Lagenidium giganteum]|uniref:Mitochondrial carrier protein n=1 Tax=Lagenidium giganteum TaxID=4803 RepID=A0AAV2ZCE0_9STRA|nr:TPA: hypothetical protein N0F65_007680 [Lagenidium giganteum]